MAEQALYESPEKVRCPGKPLHEGVKMKSELHWRPHDIAHDRTMGYLPRMAAHRG